MPLHRFSLYTMSNSIPLLVCDNHKVTSNTSVNEKGEVITRLLSDFPALVLNPTLSRVRPYNFLRYAYSLVPMAANLLVDPTSIRETKGTNGGVENVLDYKGGFYSSSIPFDIEYPKTQPRSGLITLSNVLKDLFKVGNVTDPIVLSRILGGVEQNGLVTFWDFLCDMENPTKRVVLSDLTAPGHWAHEDAVSQELFKGYITTP